MRRIPSSILSNPIYSLERPSFCPTVTVSQLPCWFSRILMLTIHIYTEFRAARVDYFLSRLSGRLQRHESRCQHVVAGSRLGSRQVACDRRSDRGNQCPEGAVSADQVSHPATLINLQTRSEPEPVFLASRILFLTTLKPTPFIQQAVEIHKLQDILAAVRLLALHLHGETWH